MKKYLARLWLALRGCPGCVLISADEHKRLVARVAQAERRAAGQRKSRAAKQQPEGETP